LIKSTFEAYLICESNIDFLPSTTSTEHGNYKTMKEILKTHLPIIKQICGEHHVKSLWAFGSVTTEDFSEESDLDFLVEFKPIKDDPDFGEYADNYLELMLSFEDLFKRKVDLVTIKPEMNAYFLKAIEKQKVRIYG